MSNIENLLKKENLTWKNFPILIVDDEVEFLEDLKKYLKEFNIVVTTNTNEVLELIRKHKISVVASDQRMPTKTGVQVLGEVKNKFPGITRILITGYTDHDTAVDAINNGEIYRYIPKKTNMAEKVTIFKQAIEIFFHREYERKTRELDQALIMSKPQPSK